MISRRWPYFLFAIWILALGSTPLWAGNYVVRLAITIAMFTGLTLSWNFIGGFTGYPSFSTAAFFGPLGQLFRGLVRREGGSPYSYGSVGSRIHLIGSRSKSPATRSRSRRASAHSRDTWAPAC